MKKILRPSFTKSDLIEEVSTQYKNLTKEQAKRIVNCIFDSMKNALSEKKRVEIRGFGSFGLKSYDAHQGKNPQTGEMIYIKSKTLPFFRVGKLKNNVTLDSSMSQRENSSE